MTRFLVLAFLALAASGQTSPEIYEVEGRRTVAGTFDFGKSRQVSFDPATGEIVEVTHVPAVRHEMVRFSGLEGRLTLPVTAGPHPALLMIHGSGRGTRDYAYYGLLAAHLASQGLAVLTYDKRAGGEDASVTELAADAVAGFDYLAHRGDVDGKRIGLFGHSQGGWIAPLVVTQRGAAFVCVLAAPAVNTWDQELIEAASDLRAHGFGDAEVAEAHTALRTMFDAIRGGTITEELRALVARVKSTPWGRFVEVSADRAHHEQLRRTLFDPTATLQTLKVPVLVLLGGNDPIVPAAVNAPLWKKYVAGGNLELHVFDGADHGLFAGDGRHDHGGTGSPFRRQFAPGVIERVTNWLLAAAGAPRTAAASQDLSGAWITDREEIFVAEKFASIFMLVDFERGRTGGFAPASGEVPLVGHGAKPTPARVAFTGDALIVREAGLPERRAHRVPLREEEIRFRNGDVELSGTLVLPSGAGPHPLVVFAHGSGPATRFNFIAWARLFATKGIAALAYDKRGNGKSGGDFRVATFHDLAADLVAAVRAVQKRPDIARVGLVGTSQGPWIAALAAAEEQSIAFIVASSGGPIGPAQQERYRRLRKLAGHPAATAETAATVLDAFFGFLLGKVPAERISGLWAAHANEPWFPLLELPRTDPARELPSYAPRFAHELAFDAAAAFAAIHQPVLILAGERDDVIPPTEVVAAARRIIPADRLTIRLFPNADHGLMMPAEPGDIPRVAPGYFATMLEWTRQQFAASSPARAD